MIAMWKMINTITENSIRIKTRRFVLLLFALLWTVATVATSELTSKSATENAQFISNSEEISPPIYPSPSTQSTPSTANTNSHLSDAYVWGHNTKYSTVIFDENITVKGSTWLDIKYPTNDDLSQEYTIIGIYTLIIDKLYFNGEENSFNAVSVSIVEGGIDRSFATIRYVSKASHNIEYNLKIFGIKV